MLSVFSEDPVKSRCQKKKCLLVWDLGSESRFSGSGPGGEFLAEGEKKTQRKWLKSQLVGVLVSPCVSHLSPTFVSV